MYVSVFVGCVLRFPPEKLQGLVEARQSGGECEHALSVYRLPCQQGWAADQPGD